MSDLNTDYNNTELLDQELTTAELSQVSGGTSIACETPVYQPATGDQLETVGANETCRQVSDPRTGISRMVCEQYIG
ncbi:MULTISPECIES: hypothetical protein [unclassified Prochlorococcus]|uniref:hypothetical protein n=1 Tax=unclassified Prochlorococcus TaxID=2627481 RepID=UPI000533991C|nr:MULTISPECIES: hypothetical protein [unclassified Prochlorococcus]KGG27147.1 hypothetical protein EV12_1402 [Prochlorococcus sp. MIT 0701]KGG28886.1 hypothetical protein EV13_1399 [Prochlorococcus sp. MIT 0702]KGG37181.1 hypothetical protein EV14_0124 [Prochlorococcus sp. MIT 0703]